jgi:hypothetical protein
LFINTGIPPLFGASHLTKCYEANMWVRMHDLKTHPFFSVSYLCCQVFLAKEFHELHGQISFNKKVCGTFSAEIYMVATICN